MNLDPKVGVGVIFTRGGTVLLLRRKFVHGAGSWPTPVMKSVVFAPAVLTPRLTSSTAGFMIFFV